MKLIANLDVNGNLLKNGEVNIGPVENQITPMNKGEIKTIEDIQNSILVGGKVPAGFTFEEFVKRFFVKKNAEKSDTKEIAPKVTVSGAIAGEPESAIIEVGAAQASYTITNTATKGTYTDGKAQTHTKTMGESTDGVHDEFIGCAEGEISWNGDENTNVITKTLEMTVFEDGSEAEEETKSIEIGNITLTQAYGASSKEMDKVASGDYLFQSSYGNPLYTAVGTAIPAGSCTATTTSGKTVSLTTKFYSWVKGTAYLGNVSLDHQTNLVSGNVIIFPEGKTLSITWTTVQPDDSSVTDQMYTEETKYIALPSEGVATLLDEEPGDAPFKTYKVWTFNNNLPGFTDGNNVKIIID